MAKKDQQGNWIDARGKAVPEEYVPEIDRRRDAMVEGCFKIAGKLAEDIISAKLKILQGIEEYLAELAKVKRTKENWKGNICLDSFDGSLRINRRMNDQIGFDEKIQLVKTILDKWIATRLHGKDATLSRVISQAFDLDKQNCINTAMLVKLLHLDIDDKDWRKAMAILKESMTVKTTSQYVNFLRKVKTDSGEDWESLVLNFNSATAKED